MNLFGYFSMGLQSMNAARLGLQVAGDNIANAFTPGYARRRLELTPGFPQEVPGGLLSSGVDVAGLRRLEDRFLQASLLREQGAQAGSEEQLRGLRQIESIFGSLGGSGTLTTAFSEFSTAFDELAAQPDNLSLRRSAVSAADRLARAFGSANDRLTEQRRLEDGSAGAFVERVNTLAGELVSLNREIAIEESSGGTASPLRDKREVVVGQLAELTGGSAVNSADGRLSFSLPGGPTLVTGDDALLLGTSRATDGTLRVLSGADGTDITDRLRGGRLGAVLQLRDESTASRIESLDTLAADFISRANALTSGAFDLQGNPGVSLFQPDPPGATGAAGRIAVNTALLQDPALLAISSTGAPGEGDGALLLSGLPDQASATLGGRSANAFLGDILTALGEEVVQSDVDEGVASSILGTLEAQRDAVSGVSLDEEAAALIQHQRSFEAAARFLQVLNSVTEVAVNLVSR